MLVAEAPKYSLARWAPIAVDDLVRLGRDMDGGYVVSARCLAATNLLIGIGISSDWSFEAAFAAARPEIKIIGVDGSVSAGVFGIQTMKSLIRALAAIARLDAAHAVRRFREAGDSWRVRGEFRKFFGHPARTFHPVFVAEESSARTLRFGELLAAHLQQGGGVRPPGVFLKMDIEGAEYRVLPDVLAFGDVLNGVVLEFHDCDLLWERFEELMERLSKTFAVVHVHGNNFAPLIRGTRVPRVLEISLVNRALLTAEPKKSSARYPLPGLDRPCDPARADYALEF